MVKIPRLTSSVVVSAGVCGSRKSTRSASVTATEEAAAKIRESVTPSSSTLGLSESEDEEGHQTDHGRDEKQ